jgi:hypothetical protein
MVSVGERISRQALRATFCVLLVLALGCGFAGAPVTSARAGQYHVYSCRTPSGESAPVDGWKGSVAEGGAFDQYATNTCASGGTLTAALGDASNHAANVDRATWAFTAPGWAKVTSATIWRAGDSDDGSTSAGTYDLWLASPGSEEEFDDCIGTIGCTERGNPTTPLSSANRVTVPSQHVGNSIYEIAGCRGVPGKHCEAGNGDPNQYAAVIYLYAADLTLEQSAGPTATNTGGELATAPTIAGTSNVTFSASDPGAGVYEALFTVDGQLVQSTVVDENGGRCKNVGQTSDGSAAFLYLQPCPSSVGADIGFDSTKVANGSHHLVVSVIDAAGNSAAVLDRTIDVANPGVPGPPNGANASPRAQLAIGWKHGRGPRLISPFGRPQAVAGRLTAPGGMPISGAQIEATATPDYTGARTAAMAPVHTDATGRFSLRLPAGASSRTLRISYRSRIGEATPTATRTLTLSVRAGLTLKVAPRTAHAGSAIRFAGRLRAGPVPHGGKLLVLEARSPGGSWLEFNVVHSDDNGRYRARYRFKFPGPARYQFRVVCQAEADYPFATGSSPVVGVFEH